MAECTLQSTQKSSHFRAILRPIVSASEHIVNQRELWRFSRHGLKGRERVMAVLDPGRATMPHSGRDTVAGLVSTDDKEMQRRIWLVWAHQRKCRMSSRSVAQAALRKRTARFAPFRGSGTPPSRQPAEVAPDHLWPLRKPQLQGGLELGPDPAGWGARQLDQTLPKSMRT